MFDSEMIHFKVFKFLDLNSEHPNSENDNIILILRAYKVINYLHISQKDIIQIQ
jgi:hypothetical protein